MFILIMNIFSSKRRSALSSLSTNTRNVGLDRLFVFHCSGLRNMVSLERGCPSSEKENTNNERTLTENANNDRIAFEWTNALERAAEQFRWEWFHRDGWSGPLSVGSGITTEDSALESG